VWECKQWERHLIVKKITEHVLSRHLSLTKESIAVTADQLDFSLGYGDAGKKLLYLLLSFKKHA